jgi:SAM-dependent methyltransferase
MIPVGLYVQFGCGFSAPEGWLSFDASPTLRFERLPGVGRLYIRNSQRFPERVRYGNIVIGLPIQENSCLGIYSSHVIEHLALNEVDLALRNVFRYLKPGGTFRLVVPDLQRLAQEYVAANDSRAAYDFMEASCLGVKSRPRGLGGLLQIWLGNSAHLWMWDEASITDKLRDHGFKQIRRAVFGDAEDSRFNEVEDAARFGGCLAMQCRK